MPWSYPDNVPPSMKYFKPSIQKKAISIANHTLKNTGDEGISIATGIKKAKLHHNSKSLVKLAMVRYNNVVIKEILNAIKKNDKEHLTKKYEDIKKKLMGEDK